MGLVVRRLLPARPTPGHVPQPGFLRENSVVYRVSSDQLSGPRTEGVIFWAHDKMCHTDLLKEDISAGNAVFLCAG